MIRIKKGIDLPIAGKPEQVIEDSRPVRSVALLGQDYVGMKPTMHIKEGDRVRCGEPLFEDKKNPGVFFTAPASGVVSGISRGAKRALLAVTIEVEGDESETFSSYAQAELNSLEREQVVDNLVRSGLWTALRTRPYSRIPAPEDSPHSIFVTAIDSHPLAADPKVVLAEHGDDFALGLDILAKLTSGRVFLCQAPGTDLPTGSNSQVSVEEFSGPHPAGLPGTHIHFLDPVNSDKTVWYVNYQDVVAIAKLFTSGKLWTERVIALGGPGADKPRLLRTRLGASTDELCAGELADGEQRVISGSVFSGHHAHNQMSYLGRYHNQVSILPEDHRRVLLGYLAPGFDQFSVFPVTVAKWLQKAGLGKKTLRFTTSANGSPRAMVPIGSYESVMPLDILATPLLRSILTGDLDMAIKLGCLELDEEDLALCTFACPGKYEYGPVLRQLLTTIEKEG